jgi:hypothetical protein
MKRCAWCQRLLLTRRSAARKRLCHGCAEAANAIDSAEEAEMPIRDRLYGETETVGLLYAQAAAAIEGESA